MTRINYITCFFLVIATWLSSSGCTFIRHNETQDNVYDHRVFVTRVIDGDTFWVTHEDEAFKVRFIGIDAPETRNSGRKKKGYFGKEAADKVRELTENQWVYLKYDVEKTDRYQRRLAYIYLENGTFLNAYLIENGFAVVDTHPPNIEYVDLFIELQQTARINALGLWAE